MQETLVVELDEPPGASLEEPPGATEEPPHPWNTVSLAQWNDWRWQMRHVLRTAEQLERVFALTSDEKAALEAPGHFRVQVTPYVASLIDRNDPNCPIRRQVIPTTAECQVCADTVADSLAEDEQSPVPGLVHRYPDRVLLLATTLCASYCRYCTRSRLVGHGSRAGVRDWQPALDYIVAHPEVRDVLVSGGDPLTLADAVLERLLLGLRAIPHVEVIRIGTRVPFFLPQRVTPELVNMLRRYHPVWVNIHFNHPAEITKEVEVALARLADAGIPLGSQSVLLAGVNDCPNTIKALGQKLVRNRVRPYYLYQCDLVEGAAHFRTPVAKGIEIMESLRGHTSGFAIPQYVIDAPGGGGKVPILPTYMISMSDTHVIVRNYEGMVTSYAQPESYRPHDPSRCPYCSGRQGVSALLTGEARAIKPEGWRWSHVKHEAGQPALEFDDHGG
ncbi:MAG: lysine 2,3-aminomutase [Anaerolineae bacterium]